MSKLMRLSQTRKSDGLFKLIKSLEKSEKRHIRLLLKHSYKKDANRYEQVFDILDQLKIYDEDRVTKNIGLNLALPPEQIPVIKHLLYNFILKGLKQLYVNKSIDFELRDLLDRVEILYSKGLFRQSFKLFKKAKVKAIDQSRYTYLAELANWSQRLQLELTGIWDEVKLKRLLEEQNQLFSSSVKHFEQEMSVFRLWSYAVTRVHSFDTTALSQVLHSKVRHHAHYTDERPLFNQDEEAQNRLSAIFHSILGNFSQSFFFYKKAVETVVRKGNWPFSGVNYLHDLLDCVIRLSSEKRKPTPDKWSLLLGQLIQCEIQHKDQVALLKFFYQLYGELSTDSTVTRSKRSYQHIQGIVISQDFFSRFKCYYYLLLHSFICENYKSSLQYLNEVQSNQFKFVFGPLNIFSRILSLIIHFELEDFALLDHLYRSADHFVKKNPFHSTVHFDLLRLVKKLYLAKDSKNLHEVMNLLLVFLENDALHQSLALGKLERKCLTSWAHARLNRSDVLDEYCRVV
mgnify:CR=1 FL=1